MSVIFFYLFIFFSPNDSTSKTMKKFFISPKKLFSFSRYSNFCDFLPSSPNFPDSKGQMKVEWFLMSWNGTHKFTDVIFGITQKPLYITSSNLVR